MISQRKIQANRRNAQKSTGPRTQEGVKKVKLNALKHGLTAQTIVLPHEDAEAYQHRLETWNRDLNPTGEPGRYLVERAVRISWQLDRADFHERARLTRRVLKVPKDRQGARKRAVDNLIRRLLDPVDQSREHYTDYRFLQAVALEPEPAAGHQGRPRCLDPEAGINRRRKPQAPGRMGKASRGPGLLDRPRSRALPGAVVAQARAAALWPERVRNRGAGQVRPTCERAPPGPEDRRGRGGTRALAHGTPQ